MTPERPTPWTTCVKGKWPTLAALGAPLALVFCFWLWFGLLGSPISEPISDDPIRRAIALTECVACGPLLALVPKYEVISHHAGAVIYLVAAAAVLFLPRFRYLGCLLGPLSLGWCATGAMVLIVVGAGV